MSNIYVIKHLYDIDGGYGDAIGCESIIGYTTSESEANEYIERYSNPIVYDIPYNELRKGKLIYEPLNQIDINKNPFENEDMRTFEEIQSDDDWDDE